MSIFSKGSWLILGGLVVVLAACSDSEKKQSLPSPTATAGVTPVSTLAAVPAASPQPTTFATLESVTAPYASMVTLLDGVCFEFLANLNGQTWLWTSPEDLTAFYDRVEDSDRCVNTVERGNFDFNGYALAGAISMATGCDSAYRVIDLVQDDTTRTQTLNVQFEVLPGCPYELVQPLLIAVPRPPEGYTFRLAVAVP